MTKDELIECNMKLKKENDYLKDILCEITQQCEKNNFITIINETREKIC